MGRQKKQRLSAQHTWGGLPVGSQGDFILMLFLLGFVVVSALAIVITKHVYRQQMQYLYHLTQVQAQQQAQWNQLQAEYSSLSALDQVEWIAKHELGMKMPEQQEISR